MLARSGPLPTRGDYAYEAKWDGFRAIVSTEDGLRVRSRRGWDMTEHVAFLAELPVRAVLDVELVALDEDGKPDFPLVCERVLMKRRTIPLTFIAFDVLSIDGEATTLLTSRFFVLIQPRAPGPYARETSRRSLRSPGTSRARRF